MIFILGACNWFRESEKWESQVDKAILVLLNAGMTLNDFVEFNTDEPSHHTCGSRNSRNNLSSNQLRLETIRVLYTVVGRAGIGASHDEIYVEILIIILLEFQRSNFDILEQKGTRNCNFDSTDLP